MNRKRCWDGKFKKMLLHYFKLLNYNNMAFALAAYKCLC